MKKFILSTILSVIFLGFITAGPDGETKVPGSEAKSAKRTVLIIGLKEGNLTSNYYMAANIAEKTSIAADSITEVFSREITQSITKNRNTRFEFVFAEKTKDNHNVLSQIQFKYDKEMMVSDLSELKDVDFHKLLDTYKADYILILDHYYLKYEGGSNLFHLVNYDIYNRNKKNIVAGKTYFNTPELMPLANYEKKYEKTGSKILDQLNKVAE